MKTWYLSDDGTEKVAYGIIKKIFSHSLYSGGPKDILIECEWLDPIPSDESAYLPQVKRNPESLFNRNCRYTFLRQVAAYNILFLIEDPWDPDCQIYNVIDRWRTYEDHSQGASE